MEHKCTNCAWEGNVLSEKPLKGYCPVCGDKVSKVEESIKPLEEPIEESKPESRSLKDKLIDILDDGKLNHSNKPSKKSKRGKR